MNTLHIGFAGLSLPIQRKPIQQMALQASAMNRIHFGGEGDSFSGLWTQEQPDFKAWMKQFNKLPQSANWTETAQKRREIINRLINDYLIPNVSKSEPVSVVASLTNIEYKFRLDGHEVTLDYPRPMADVPNERQPMLSVDGAGYSFGEKVPLERSVVKLKKALEGSDETFYGPLAAKFGLDAKLDVIPLFKQLAASTRNGGQEWERGSNMHPFQSDRPTWTTFLPDDTMLTIGELFHGFVKQPGGWSRPRVTVPAIWYFIGLKSPDGKNRLVLALSDEEDTVCQDLVKTIRRAS